MIVVLKNDPFLNKRCYFDKRITQRITTIHLSKQYKFHFIPNIITSYDLTKPKVDNFIFKKILNIIYAWDLYYFHHNCSLQSIFSSLRRKDKKILRINWNFSWTFLLVIRFWKGISIRQNIKRTCLYVLYISVSKPK